MTDNCIAVLGTGKSQIPLIRAAKSRGFKVLGFDINPQSEGIDLCDSFFNLSLADATGIASTLDTHRPSAIISYSSSPVVLNTLAALCSRFSTPGIAPALLDSLENKLTWKQVLRHHGIPTPDWQTVSESGFSAQGASYYIKPVSGGRGSKGVQKLDKHAQIAASEDSTHQYFVEDEVKGKEINLSGIVQRNEILALTISRKHHTQIADHRVPLGFQSHLIDNTKYSELAQRCCNAIGLNNSLFSIDLIETEEQCFVIDIGCMLDARIDWALSHIGAPIYNWMLDLALALPINIDPDHLNKAFSLMFIYCDRNTDLLIADRCEHRSDHSIFWEKAGRVCATAPQDLSDTLGCIITTDGAQPTWDELAKISKTLIKSHTFKESDK